MSGKFSSTLLCAESFAFAGPPTALSLPAPLDALRGDVRESLSESAAPVSNSGDERGGQPVITPRVGCGLHISVIQQEFPYFKP